MIWWILRVWRGGGSCPLGVFAVICWIERDCVYCVYCVYSEYGVYWVFFVS